MISYQSNIQDGIITLWLSVKTLFNGEKTKWLVQLATQFSKFFSWRKPVLLYALSAVFILLHRILRHIIKYSLIKILFTA